MGNKSDPLEIQSCKQYNIFLAALLANRSDGLMSAAEFVPLSFFTHLKQCSNKLPVGESMNLCIPLQLEDLLKQWDVVTVEPPEGHHFTHGVSFR